MVRFREPLQPISKSKGLNMAGITRKASKLIRGLIAVVKQPALLNLVLDDESVHERAFKSESQMPLGFPEIDFRTFASAAETIKPFAFLDGGSLPTDLALLKIIARKLQASAYFEIGTWRGESVNNVASVVENCFTLNLSNEELKRRNLPEKYIQLHGHFSKNNPRITHLYGDSRTFDFEQYEGKMDLVFVDGDHHFDSVVQDTKTAFKLIKPGGAIVWHDYANSPENVRWNVARAIYLGTPPEFRSQLRAVSHTLCAVFLPFEVPSAPRTYPRNPDSGFELTITQLIQ
jgi:predicted O-methyltransferase YrrM